MRPKGSVARKAIYLFLLLIVIVVIYTIYDFRQAKQMAAEVCKSAVPGMSLDNLLSTVSEKDFKIIRKSEYTLIVPRKGLGRNHCTVTHDGRLITGSKSGFAD
jgi:hypothetical protein